MVKYTSRGLDAWLRFPKAVNQEAGFLLSKGCLLQFSTLIQYPDFLVNCLLTDHISALLPRFIAEKTNGPPSPIETYQQKVRYGYHLTYKFLKNNNNDNNDNGYCLTEPHPHLHTIEPQLTLRCECGWFGRISSPFIIFGIFASDFVFNSLFKFQLFRLFIRHV